MRLHQDVFGTGRDLVFLHGWGMHSGLWSAAACELADSYRITLIDLPGHGYSERYAEPVSLIDLTEYIAACLPGPCILIGWSLGGLIAQQLAYMHPEQIEQLILVASSPCFAKRFDWPCALDEKVLAEFCRHLEQDPDGTLRRFIALQTLGNPDKQILIRAVQNRLLDRHAADTRALVDGFNILRHSDLRQQLTQLRCPVSLMLGADDRIVSPGVAEQIQHLLPDSRCYLFRHGGHIPFLTHTEEFVTTIRNRISA